MTKTLKNLKTKCRCLVDLDQKNKPQKRKAFGQHLDHRKKEAKKIAKLAFKQNMTPLDVRLDLGVGRFKNTVLEHLKPMIEAKKERELKKTIAHKKADGYIQISDDAWNFVSEAGLAELQTAMKAGTKFFRVNWQKEIIEVLIEDLKQSINSIQDQLESRKPKPVHPEGTTWDDVLKKAMLTGNKLAERVVEDLEDPRFCDASWLAEAVAALAMNRIKKGLTWQAFDNGEIGAHRALCVALKAHRRHTETYYDDFCREYGKDIARDMIR